MGGLVYSFDETTIVYYYYLKFDNINSITVNSEYVKLAAEMTGRSTGSIKAKMFNINAVIQGNGSLSHGGKICKEVIDKYKNNEQLLKKDYEKLKISSSISYEEFSQYEEGFDEYPEGKLRFIEHLKRERNKELVNVAKEKFKSINNGKLFCEICGFDFSEKYGDRGNSFIEAHHIKPIAEMGPNETTKIEDLVMVCSNCHRMLHRKPKISKRNELKRILKEKDSIVMDIEREQRASELKSELAVIMKERFNMEPKCWGNIIYLPVYTAISAGYGTDAFEEPIGYIPIEKSELHPPEKGKYFFLKVDGESMINAGINDGDYVLVRRSGKPKSGDIVAARLDNDKGVLKTMYKLKDGIRFEPANPDYEPFTISGEEFENNSAGYYGVVQEDNTLSNPEILSEDDIDRDKIL